VRATFFTHPTLGAVSRAFSQASTALDVAIRSDLACAVSEQEG
jgi:hypothetical protein